MSAPVTDDVVLRVNGLSTTFYQAGRPNPAVIDVSFQVHAGQTLGLVGESGCGKSATAASIMQLLPPLARIDRGEVIYHSADGVVDIATLRRDGKRMRSLRGPEIAMIFQDPMVSLNPVYTVGWQIVEMIRLHKKVSRSAARQSAVSLLGQMGIPDPERRFDEYPHQFSGGMRQRAMIAMALACEPRLLVADEPTTALDVTIQAQIFELLKQQSVERSMATILITHDMCVVAELTDRVAVMYMGRIVEYGRTQDILDDPQHPYTRALIAAIPQLGRGKDQQLVAVGGSTPDPYHRPPGCQFAPRCPLARDVCDTIPPMVEVGEGHAMHCWRLSFDD